MPLSLASVLSPFVSGTVRHRGEQYQRSGLVRLRVCNGSRVEATVSGTDEYAVALQREDRMVWASCTCPYSTDRDEVCKHIWATVLAADARGGLRRDRGDLPNELDVDNLAWDDDEDGASLDPAPPPRGPRAAAPPAPSWRGVLAALANAAPPTTDRADEILYVLDLPLSLKRQGLVLDLLTCQRKKDGTRGALRPLRLTRAEAARLRDPLDRELLALLSGAMNGELWSNWYGVQFQEIPRLPWVPNEMAWEVAKRACATGRCHLRARADQVEDLPLTWDDGPPWELWLTVRSSSARSPTDGGAFEVAAELRRGAERLALGERVALADAGLLLAAGTLARLDTGGAAAWLRLLPPAEPLRASVAEGEELLEALFAAPVLPHLDLPPALAATEATVPPQPHLRLLPPPRPDAATNAWLLARLAYLYAGREVSAGARTRGVYQHAERRLLLRDRAAEEKAAARLVELGFRPSVQESGEEPTLRIAPGRVGQAVRALLAEGWSVEAQGKLYRTPGRFDIRVASGVDWFELHGNVEFDGEIVGLPRLLEALRRGDGFVPLRDGGMGLLPETWLQRWAPLAGLGEAEGDHLRFAPPQAVLLDAWLADEPEARWDETFAQAHHRLASFTGIAPAEAPAGFAGVLRPYQRLGLGWLHFLRDFGLGGCLADDMGLGKTVQVLALLESRREERATQGLPPSLVVVPRSLVFNWQAEAAQFTPALRVLDYTGTGRAQEGEPFAGHDVVLTTYGTLRRDIGVFREREFDYVILDEAQAIKTASSQTAKAARLLRGRHRLALTGTPVENHLGELLSLLEFMNPGFLGSKAASARAADLHDPAAAAALGRALRPLLLRRTKQQVAPELPARVEQTLPCELPARQRRLYDELRDYYRAVLDKRIGAQGLGRAKLLVLEALLRLRQAACHPALLDRGRADEPSAKLDLLLPQLAEVLAEGHKALVFSQFTSFLALLRLRLEAAGLPYLYLDGKTRNRAELVTEFQSESGRPLFLISLKAGGLGLNLTAAEYVYLLDPWWNPAVEAQAVDRAHRIGQTRTVFAYRLVAKDTVEEKILELQAGKRALADAIIQADESLIARLSREDLELLLS
jgi:superfamily II DNA or RNA helicase